MSQFASRVDSAVCLVVNSTSPGVTLPEFEPHFLAYQLCDLGQVFHPLYALLPHIENENNFTHLNGSELIHPHWLEQCLSHNKCSRNFSY